MKKILWTSAFSRALKKQIKGKPELRIKIEDALNKLSGNPDDPTLRTHKLKGKFLGTKSCTVDYDCRIIFEITQNEQTFDQEIILIDIGTHDDVY